MTDKTTIACKKVSLETLAYREVISVDKDNFYLDNVNILLGRKIIKKIRFQPGEKPYEKGMGKDIAIQYLRDTLSSGNNKNNKESENQNDEKVNPEAACKAAKDLFTEIGL